jgi:autotransporter-associated beta strand protein
MASSPSARRSPTTPDPTAIFGDGDDGVVSLSKSGTGDVFLTGPNSYSGQTIVSGGVLHVTSNQNLGNPAANAPVAVYGSAGMTGATGGGVLAVDATMTTQRPIRMGGGTIRIADNQTLALGNNTLTPLAESPRKSCLALEATTVRLQLPRKTADVNLGASQNQLTGLTHARDRRRRRRYHRAARFGQC